MEYPAQSHPDVLSLLCEGDSSTWDAKAWTFDEDALKAAPNKDHVPAQGLQHMSCCAYKRSRGTPEVEATAEGKSGSCRAGETLAGDAPATSCCAPLDLSSFSQGGVRPDASLQVNGTTEHHAADNHNANFSGTYGLTPELPAAAAQNASGPVGVGGAAVASMGVTATGTAPPWFSQAPSDVPFMQSNMNMPGGSGEGEVKPEQHFIPPDAITLLTARKDLAPNKCWVVGCEKSITDLREFHLRYHICDEHIRATCILRNGVPERFCQQCARFHSVDLFDGNRRSCRVQLQKHNERRRKRSNPKAAAAADAQTAKPDDKDTLKALQNGGSISDVSNLHNTFANQMPPLGQAGLPMPKFPGVMSASNGMMDMQALQLPDFSSQRLLGSPTDMLPYGNPGLPGAPAASVNARDAMVHEVLQALMSNPSLALSLRRLMLSDSEGNNNISDARASHITSASAQLQNPSAPSAVSHRTIRLSFKLLRCLPDDLPADLKPQLLRWLEAAPTGVEGCIRPGCVMLTVQAVVTLENYARLRRLGLVSLVMHLLCSGCTFWHRVNMVVQAFNSVAICSKGKLISIQDVSAPALSSSLPQLDAVSSHVLLSDGRSPLNLCLKGARLNTPGVSIIVRQGANCSLLTSTCARDPNMTDIQIAVPTFTNGCAIVWVEAQMGGYLTQALPILVCTSVQLAGHVHNMSRALITRATAAASFAEAQHWTLCNERLLMGIFRPFGIDAPPLWLCPTVRPPVLVPCNAPRVTSLDNINTSRGGSSNGSCCGANAQQLVVYDGPVLGVPVVDCSQPGLLAECKASPAEQQTPSCVSNCCTSSLELLDGEVALDVQLQNTSSQSSQPENFNPCNAKAAPKACQCNVGSSFDAVREMLCQPPPLFGPGFDDGSDEEFAIFLDQLFPEIVAT